MKCKTKEKKKAGIFAIYITVDQIFKIVYGVLIELTVNSHQRMEKI